jgi:hypothetical protein
VPSTIVTWSTRRLRTGANANSGPRVSITRCAAECDTPNNGPIWRIVRFVRQYVATSNTRSGNDKLHCRPRRPSAIAGPPRTATVATSLRNWPSCNPVNGTIHSDRDAEITCTPT